MIKVFIQTKAIDNLIAGRKMPVVKNANGDLLAGNIYTKTPDFITESDLTKLINLIGEKYNIIEAN